MSLGGLVAGLVVAVGAGVVARATELKEDALLAAFYLISWPWASSPRARVQCGSAPRSVRHGAWHR